MLSVICVPLRAIYVVGGMGLGGPVGRRLRAALAHAP